MLLAIYLFCAGLGIPLVALFALGGGDGDAELGGLDVDVDAGGVDFDADFDADGGGFEAPDASGVGDFTGLIRRIPVSSYAMFLAFFGGSGAAGTWLGVGTAGSLVLAVVLGLLAATFNAALFGWLRANSADSSLSDTQLVGRVATVSVPIEAGRRGRVWLDTGHERVQISASALDGAGFGRGDNVIIVEMADGIASVIEAGPELELE